MKDNSFDPQSVTVTPGSTVSWDNSNANNPHTVTFQDGTDSSGGLPCPGPGCLDKKQNAYSRTFNQAGSFPYYCKIHAPNGQGPMTGSVVVQAAQATAAPTPAPTSVRTTTAPRTTAPARPTPRATPTLTPTATPPRTTPPVDTPLPTGISAPSPQAKEDDDGGTPVLNILAIGLGAAAVLGAGIAGLTAYLRRTRPPA